MADKQKGAAPETSDAQATSQPKPKVTPAVKSAALPEGEKLLATLGYISFFCILPLALKPNSAYCQHHGKRGLAITLLFFLLSWLGMLESAFAWILTVLHIMLAVMGILHAQQGKKWNPPFISAMAEKFNW